MTSSPRQRTGAHRPRRRTGPALITLLLLVVAAVVAVGIGALGRVGLPSASSTSAGTPVAASAARSPVPSPAVPPTPVTSSTSPQSDPTGEVDRSARVTVLNGTGRPGLATGVAAVLRSAGWSVAGTGNYRQDPPPTTVYYSGSDLRATARAVSADLPGVQRVVRSTRFGDPAVTVVLGADYSG
jgi:hypothetical protein